MKNKVIIGGVWILALANTVPAASPGSTNHAGVITELRQAIRQRLEKQKAVPGLAIALVDDASLVWAEGFGHTSAERREPVTSATVFSVQSISKHYTALVFLRAVERGRVKLDDRLVSVLPDFQVNSRWGGEVVAGITFRQLLSHFAGFAHEAPVGNNFDPRSPSSEAHVRSISDTWLRFRPGERFGYSNLGIDLTAHALQVRLRRPYARLAKDMVFNPLGMSSSTFDYEKAVRSASFAPGHQDGKPVPRFGVPMVGSGGMYSNVLDMARATIMHLEGGKARGRLFLAASTLSQMYRPAFAAEGQLAGYGLGTGVRQWRGSPVYSHSGGGFGYSAMQLWAPGYGIGVIVLANCAEGVAPEVAYQALELMTKAKLGRLPDQRVLPYATRPAVTLRESDLRILEGTYKPRGNLVRVSVQDGSLYLGKTKLKPISQTEFIPEDPKNMGLIRFTLGDNGRAHRLDTISDAFVESLALNDWPGEPAGPAKPEWERYLGVYKPEALMPVDLAVRAFLKNGYLYLTLGGAELKLTEHRPGIFFTCDGTSAVWDKEGDPRFDNVRWKRQR